MHAFARASEIAGPLRQRASQASVSGAVLEALSSSGCLQRLGLARADVPVKPSGTQQQAAILAALADLQRQLQALKRRVDAALLPDKTAGSGGMLARRPYLNFRFSHSLPSTESLLMAGYECTTNEAVLESGM